MVESGRRLWCWVAGRREVGGMCLEAGSLAGDRRRCGIGYLRYRQFGVMACWNGGRLSLCILSQYSKGGAIAACTCDVVFMTLFFGFGLLAFLISFPFFSCFLFFFISFLLFLTILLASLQLLPGRDETVGRAGPGRTGSGRVWSRCGRSRWWTRFVWGVAGETPKGGPDSHGYVFFLFFFLYDPSDGSSLHVLVPRT